MNGFILKPARLKSDATFPPSMHVAPILAATLLGCVFMVPLKANMNQFKCCGTIKLYFGLKGCVAVSIAGNK